MKNNILRRCYEELQVLLDLYTEINDLVIMDIVKRGSRKYYTLVCQFGHEVEVRADSLKSSRVCRMCDKKNKRLTSLKRVPSVYKGYTKGQLKVLGFLPRLPSQRSKVLTSCTCGNTQSMFVDNLVKVNQSWSCGRCKPYYKYEEDEIHVYYESGGSELRLIADREDSTLILENIWTVHRDSFNNYIRSCSEGRTFLHRILINCPEDMVVDHINGNGLDNRKCNLRVVSKEGNSRNTKVNKNNSSGKMGVYYREDTGKWRAFINGEDGRVDLGSYSTKEEAISRREEAEHFYGYHENHGRLISKKEDSK